MTLAQIAKIDWQYLVNRAEAQLYRSFTALGYKYFCEATGIPVLITGVIKLGNGDYYYRKSEIDALKKYFVAGGVRRLQSFRHRLIASLNRYDRLARKLEYINYERLSQRQLQQLLCQFANAGLRVHNFLLPMPVADRALSEMILSFFPPGSPKKHEKWLRTLSYPVRESSHTLEERAFYKLVVVAQRGSKRLPALVKQHVAQYGWIGARWYWWENAWTERDIIGRIRHFRAQRQNPSKALAHLAQLHREHARTARHLIKQLHAKGISRAQLTQLSRLAQEYAYLRTWRTDITYRAGYRVRNLFYEVARRANFEPSDVSYLTILEVMKMARTRTPPITKRAAARRKESCSSVYLAGKYKIFPGRAWETELRTLLEQSLAPTRVITGSVAFPGKTRGTVRIVRGNNDIARVRAGDILVVVMTFPHFVPAMEKAAAFVTDEGGILCHAAIVSREMRKPCIIGTKIATQVLKDGDYIEVDANRGVVRILH